MASMKGYLLGEFVKCTFHCVRMNWCQPWTRPSSQLRIVAVAAEAATETTEATSAAVEVAAMEVAASVRKMLANCCSLWTFNGHPTFK